MTRQHEVLGAALIVSLAGAHPAWAGAPATHAVVLADPLDGAAGREHAAAVSDLLLASESFALLDPGFLEGRLLEDPGGLFRRCASDVACWRSAGLRGGVAQMVLVELVDQRTLGVRVVDVAATGDFRMATAAVAPGGRPDPTLIDRLFFDVGTLRLTSLPPGALVRIDDGPAMRTDGVLELTVRGGTHAVEVVAPDEGTRFFTGMVYPDRTTTMTITYEPGRKGRQRISRWTTWVAAGIVAGGAAAVGLATEANGRAAIP